MNRPPFGTGRLPVKAINSTPAVLWLIAVLVGVHLLRLIPWEPMLLYLQLLAFNPSRFLLACFWPDIDIWLRLPVLLSPLTHALLHGDFIHLAVNSAFLLAFGTELDRRLGRRRFLTLFAICVIAGAVAVMAQMFIVQQAVVVLGASGGVSGLFGALVRDMPRHRLIVIVSFVVINIAIGIVGIPSINGMQAVAWDAHLGGFFAGFLLLPLFRRRSAAI